LHYIDVDVTRPAVRALLRGALEHLKSTCALEWPPLVSNMLLSIEMIIMKPCAPWLVCISSKIP
jgi:hypothetical protein